MKNLILLLIFFCLGVTPLIAQQTVKGQITDEKNVPLPGATATIKHTQKGTFTDANGNYSIVVSPGDTLVFSMLGMAVQTIPVNGKSVINVKLIEEATALNEVVVIGYGTVKKSDLSGSVSVVKSEELTKVTALSPEQSLQGKVPGVQVTSSSGAPGSLPSVRIRGTGTFGNSSPIYVVDGFIVDDISFLSSSDIESMDILKDASATSMYGSRGANGVIMVTTKTGKKGQQKATFNYSGEYSQQVLTKKIDLLTGKEYATVVNEIIPTYNNLDLVPNTDWQSLIFHTAPIQSHQFSATGATETSQYYVGVGFFNQSGIIDKSSYERLSLKMNNTYNLTKNIKFGSYLTITPFKQQNAPNVTSQAYRARPDLKPYNADGTFANVYNVGNPLADLAYSNSYNKGVRGVGNLFAEITFLKDFRFKSSYGMDAAYNYAESFTPAFFVSSQQNNLYNSLSKGWSFNISWLWENTLTYTKQLGDHFFDIVAGYTMQKATSEGLSLAGKNIIRTSKDFWYFEPNYIYNQSSSINTLNTISNNVDANLNYTMISYLFRANYTYKSKYILTATFRRDGSSKFSSVNRYSNFPSFAAGWVVSKEPFMQNIPAISNLKLRTSWGMIGNDKIDYRGRYSLTQSNITILGNPSSINSALTYGKSGNPDLKWETTKQFDAGAEIGLLKNKLSGEFDYYHRVTVDILLALATPGYMGNGQGATVYYNAASVKNTGIEGKITWKDEIGKLGYSVSIVGTTCSNEVLKIGGSKGIDSLVYGGFLPNGIPVTRSVIGLPIGAFFGYKTDGLFQTAADIAAYPHLNSTQPGDIKYVDINKDGKIDDNDRTYIGSPIPTFTMGLNLGLSYRGFDLSLDLQGVYGNKVYNAKDNVRPDPYNWEHHVINAWTAPGTTNSEPRATYGGDNYRPSDRFVQDASFTRLRNVIIGYTLPSELTGKIYLSQVRFYMKATNVFTITKFTGYSPEVGGGQVIDTGIDGGIYPITSDFSFGINLTF